MIKRFILFFTLCCIFSCKAMSSENTIIKFDSNKKIIIINNDKKIDLKKSIDEILNELNSNYKKRLAPKTEAYYIDAYNIELQYDYDTKKLRSIACNFYGKDGKQKRIKKVTIGNITIDINTSYEEAKKILKKSSIEYSIDEDIGVYYIEPINFSISWIIYVDERLSSPKQLMINIRK